MKAQRALGPGRLLALETLGTPTPGSGTVLVKVLACGVCRTDLHLIDGELPDLRLPVVPGHEVVGRVEAAGAGVSAPRSGRRWRGCRACARCTTT